MKPAIVGFESGCLWGSENHESLGRFHLNPTF